MEITIKSFNELTLEELYGLLQLRSEVFVVEQNCVYQDVDEKDKKAIHILGKKDAKMVAYTRVFKPAEYFKLASIGRVVVQKEERKYGLGQLIMQESITYINKCLKETKIEISAQVYLNNFYTNLGFIKKGEEYLEDGIPHIRMIWTKS